MNNNGPNFIRLRIKRKSLAAEAKIIKSEEHALKMATYYVRSTQQPSELADRMLETRMDLRKHRKQIVSFEARAAHLANAFLRGQKYDTVERSKALLHPNIWRNSFYSRSQLLARTADIAAKYISDNSYKTNGARKPQPVMIEELKNWMA